MPGYVYVALLRGVNVGGNSLISMKELKSGLEKAGFQHVSTYINSGNVLFTSKEKDPRLLEKRTEAVLQKNHKLNSKVMVRNFSEIQKTMKKMPAEWKDNKDEWRQYVIFLSPTIDSKKILKNFSLKEDIEKMDYIPGALFSSTQIKALTRSTLHKLIGTPIYKEMTIRNSNTVRKLYALMKDYTF